MKFDEDMFIAGYLSKTYPVQWVGWWDHLKDTPDADTLGRILFPDGESLADLTDEARRLEIYKCIISTPPLREAVLKEIWKAIQKQWPDGSMTNELKRHVPKRGKKWMETARPSCVRRYRAAAAG